MFSMQLVSKSPSIATFQLLSAASFNLGRSQSGVLGNGLKKILMVTFCYMLRWHQETRQSLWKGSIVHLQKSIDSFQPTLSAIFGPDHALAKGDLTLYQTTKFWTNRYRKNLQTTKKKKCD